MESLPRGFPYLLFANSVKFTVILGSRKTAIKQIFFLAFTGCSWMLRHCKALASSILSNHNPIFLCMPAALCSLQLWFIFLLCSFSFDNLIFFLFLFLGFWESCPHSFCYSHLDNVRKNQRGYIFSRNIQLSFCLYSQKFLRAGVLWRVWLCHLARILPIWSLGFFLSTSQRSISVCYNYCFLNIFLLPSLLTLNASLSFLSTVIWIFG